MYGIQHVVPLATPLFLYSGGGGSVKSCRSSSVCLPFCRHFLQDHGPFLVTPKDGCQPTAWFGKAHAHSPENATSVFQSPCFSLVATEGSDETKGVPPFDQISHIWHIWHIWHDLSGFKGTLALIFFCEFVGLCKLFG